ncbi:MAG: GGDEF domain-containing protein [Pseudomonadota bacterium]
MRFQDLEYSTPTPLLASSTGRDVAQFFQIDSQYSICPVVDSRGTLVGCIPRIAFLKQLSAPYGRALYERKPATSFIDAKQNIVSINTRVQAFLSHLDFGASEVLRDGLALVDGDQTYLGILSGLRLLGELHRLNNQMVSALRREISDRKAAEAHVRKLADTDALTGTLNRRAFDHALETLTRTSTQFACAYIDLDGFKPLNDQYGHAIGDEMLSTIGKRLQALDKDIIVSRVGGDEFVLALRDCPAERFAKLCQRAMTSIRHPKLTAVGSVVVSASIGWSVFPDDTRNVRELIAKADHAMLDIKAKGGGVQRTASNAEQSTLQRTGTLG